MKTKLSDGWRTPQWLFDELDKEFQLKNGFDLCATKENTKCREFCEDIFAKGAPVYAVNYNVFMNPPYSNPYPFVERALIMSEAARVVCLLKVDTSTKWWALFWDYNKHKPIPGVEVRFLRKRVKFDPPIGWEGKVTTPAFPSCIVIMDRRK